MELINQNYLITTKKSKIIIFMRGGIVLVLQGLKMKKKKKIQITQNCSLQILSRWVILHQRKTNQG